MCFDNLPWCISGKKNAIFHSKLLIWSPPSTIVIHNPNKFEPKLHQLCDDLGASPSTVSHPKSQINATKNHLLSILNAIESISNLNDSTWIPNQNSLKSTMSIKIPAKAPWNPWNPSYNPSIYLHLYVISHEINMKYHEIQLYPIKITMKSHYIPWNHHWNPIKSL